MVATATDSGSNRSDVASTEPPTMEAAGACRDVFPLPYTTGNPLRALEGMVCYAVRIYGQWRVLIGTPAIMLLTLDL